MKMQDQDHGKDLLEIRAMMERSSKFVWLSGWAGIIAGFFALTGVYIAYAVMDFHPDTIDYSPANGMQPIMILGSVILALAAASATLLSYNQAKNSRERLWNATSRRLLYNMAVPFLAGAMMILILIGKNLAGLAAPVSLVFYGLALYNASKYTFEEVRVMGVVQILLGLAGLWFVQHSLLIWALGFGVVHIVYGIYIHIKYKR
ncbi:MAG: hypothetical protein EOP53_24470 [Sphingobacteriales bacterium]|nr:MAG: hypothetical protein EOP53_24470 [Sphingobacteriales bacterium]